VDRGIARECSRPCADSRYDWGGIGLASFPRFQGGQGARGIREGVGEEGKWDEGSRGSVPGRVPPPDTTGGIGLASFPRLQCEHGAREIREGIVEEGK
jgi:hypothetical protein